jgi:hypothetical protein
MVTLVTLRGRRLAGQPAALLASGRISAAQVGRGAAGDERTRDARRIGYALEDALAGRRDLDWTFILVDGYSPQNDFYVRVLQDRGVDVARKDWRELQAGDRVLVADRKIQTGLLATYACEVVDRSDRVTTYEIRGKLVP